MFDICGDDIFLEGVRIGHLEGGWPTLRDRAEHLLSQGASTDATDRAYHRGYDDALKALWKKK